MLATGGILDTLLSGGLPVVCVALATAMVTVWSERRRKSNAKDEKIAQLEATEIPQWGKTLQDDVGRIARSLYGDQPWGSKGFFVEFADFKKDVLDALRDGDTK